MTWEQARSVISVVVVPRPLGDVRPRPLGAVVVVPRPFGDVAPSPLGNVVVVPSPFADVVLSPLGMLLPDAVGDPPLMQFEAEASKPRLRLFCVASPLQAVPGDPTAWLITPVWVRAPLESGSDVFAVPNIDTDVPTPDAGDEGTWVPPPGNVIALGATVLFGFAKADGAVVNGELVGGEVRGTKVDWITLPGRVVMRLMELVCATAPELPAATRAAAASEVKSLWVFMNRVSWEGYVARPTQATYRRSAIEAGEPAMARHCDDFRKPAAPSSLRPFLTQPPRGGGR